MEIRKISHLASYIGVRLQLMSRGMLTNEMSTFLDNPSRWTVEPMVVTRCKVNDTEEQRVPGLESHRSRAPPPLQGWPNTHLGGNRGIVRDNLGRGTLLRHRSIRPLTMLDGRCARVGFVGHRTRRIRFGGAGARAGGGVVDLGTE